MTTDLYIFSWIPIFILSNNDNQTGKLSFDVQVFSMESIESLTSWRECVTVPVLTPYLQNSSRNKFSFAFYPFGVSETTQTEAACIGGAVKT